jgi:hypothetical protein
MIFSHSNIWKARGKPDCLSPLQGSLRGQSMQCSVKDLHDFVAGKPLLATVSPPHACLSPVTSLAIKSGAMWIQNL